MVSQCFIERKAFDRRPAVTGVRRAIWSADCGHDALFGRRHIATTSTRRVDGETGAVLWLCGVEGLLWFVSVWQTE